MAAFGRSKRLSLREKVEATVASTGCSWLESITHYMQENGLNPARMAKLLDPYLFNKLRDELRESKIVQQEVLDRFFRDGRLKMKREEARELGDKLQIEIDHKEAILKVIQEKKKRDAELRAEQPRPREMLLYESRLEEELRVLIELANLCSLISGE